MDRIYKIKNLNYIVFIYVLLLIVSPTRAADVIEENSLKPHDYMQHLVPHKALYDINLVATRSGSQVVNIRGKMFYEWKPTCEAWITDHRFNLYYDYADSPSMKVTSDFSTFETFDGQDFNFSARRKRDDKLYQELRGRASLADKGGQANFTVPDNLGFELSGNSFFPMGHTAEIVKSAKTNKKFFQAVVFDGSDDGGPVEINSFIGKPVNAMKFVNPSEALDMSLLNTNAWNVRMAVFPTKQKEASSDYEMSMIFHENGVISDMLIEYDDFSVTQKLVALDKLEGDSACHALKSGKNLKSKK